MSLSLLGLGLTCILQHCFKGTSGFIIVCSKVVLCIVKKWFLQIFFLQVPFYLVLTSSTCFGFIAFQIFHRHKKLRKYLLDQVFTKAVHISTIWSQTKWSLALWLNHDKASYVAKEDGICLFCVAKEAALNKQWIKPSVPLVFSFHTKTCFLDNNALNWYQWAVGRSLKNVIYLYIFQLFICQVLNPYIPPLYPKKPR